MKSRILFLFSFLCFSYPLLSMDAPAEEMVDQQVVHEEFECAICLNEPDDAVDVTPLTLPCNHTFHRGCLLGWMEQFQGQQSFTCPACRTRVNFDQIELPGHMLLRLHHIIPQAVQDVVVEAPGAPLIYSMIERYYRGINWLRNVGRDLGQRINSTLPEWMQASSPILLRLALLLGTRHVVLRFMPPSVRWHPRVALLTSAVLAAEGSSWPLTMGFQRAMRDISEDSEIGTYFGFYGHAALGYTIGTGMRLILDRSGRGERVGYWLSGLDTVGLNLWPSSDSSS